LSGPHQKITTELRGELGWFSKDEGNKTKALRCQAGTGMLKDVEGGLAGLVMLFLAPNISRI
jgi:hypothetical protein